VNLDTLGGEVTLRLLSDEGTVIGTPRTETIPARGKLYITDQSYFTDASKGTVSGYVEIKGDGIHLAGSILFGDPAQSRFSSTLPLASTMHRSVVLAHVASNETYFMGISMLNPGASETTATIEIFTLEGARRAWTDVKIAGGGRSIGLLTKYFPDQKAVPLGSGHVKVTSDQDIAVFGLFGTNNLTALSAIPAQPAP
jgi:hypothetical protein